MNEHPSLALGDRPALERQVRRMAGVAVVAGVSLISVLTAAFGGTSILLLLVGK